MNELELIQTYEEYNRQIALKKLKKEKEKKHLKNILQN